MNNNSYREGFGTIYKRQEELIVANIIKVINLMCLNGNVNDKLLIIADRRFYVINEQIYICENENDLTD